MFIFIKLYILGEVTLSSSQAGIVRTQNVLVCHSGMLSPDRQKKNPTYLPTVKKNHHGNFSA